MVWHRVRDPGASRRASLKHELTTAGRRRCQKRDPGDLRRASLKRRRGWPCGRQAAARARDPDDSRRASLKRVRNREQGTVARRVDPGASRRASFVGDLAGVFRPWSPRSSDAGRVQRLGHQIGMLGRQSGALDLESRWRSEIPSSRASGYRPIPPRPRSRPASFLGTQNRRETGLEEVPPLARRLTRILRHHGPVVSNRTLRRAQRQPLARHPHLVAASRVLAHYLQVAAA